MHLCCGLLKFVLDQLASVANTVANLSTKQGCERHALNNPNQNNS